MDAVVNDEKLLRDIIEWDVATWALALPFWEKHSGNPEGQSVLDIGARNGGLSLYWALRGARVVCSDKDGPSEEARAMHMRYGIAQQITYRSIDATNIPLPDNCFDRVCFKSVLGGIGSGDSFANQLQAIAEMHRVLKPGGRLVFAENLCGSVLHRFLRRRYAKWASYWRYVSLKEVAQLFSEFCDLQLRAYGFFSAFGQSEWQRRLLHGMDRMTLWAVSNESRYVVFGVATK